MYYNIYCSILCIVVKKNMDVSNVNKHSCNNYILYSIAYKHIKFKDILSVKSAKNMDVKYEHENMILVKKRERIYNLKYSR